MRNSWKRVTVGLLALALVAGVAPANVGTGGLFGGAAIVAYAAEESESFSTNTKASTYTGDHFKIEVTNVGDKDGFRLSSDGTYSATITALNGEVITKIELVRSYYDGEPHVSSESAVKSVSDETFTFTNINATSVLLDCCTGDIYCQIRQVKVYYKILTACEKFNYASEVTPTWQLDSDIEENIEITRDDGVIDLNGHTITGNVFLQNNDPDKTVTIKNGTIIGELDGAPFWSDFYKGKVVLENVNVGGTIWTDGHDYTIKSGIYNGVIYALKDAETTGKTTITGGTFNGSVAAGFTDWGQNVAAGTFSISGGTFKNYPPYKIADGYAARKLNDYWTIVSKGFSDSTDIITGDLTVTNFFNEKTNMIELKDGDNYTFKFKNKSNGTENWENFVLAITGAQGDAYSDWTQEILILRADCWGWGGGMSDFVAPNGEGNKLTFISNCDFNTFESECQAGVDVEITLIKDGNTIIYDATIGNYYVYLKATSGIALPESIYAFFTGQKCELTDIQTVNNNLTSHDWNDPEYIWTETAGGYKCTASRTCNNGSHPKTEEVTATYEVVTASTAGAKGLGRYTATFTNDEFVEQTKDVEIEMLTPEYADATYTWADDNSSVTAFRECTNGGADLTETVNTTSEVTKAATCKAMGETTYYAVFANELFARQEKVVENIDKIAHSPAEAVIENRVEPTYDTNGSYDSVVYCSKCGEELNRETIVIPMLEKTEVIINSVDINGNITKTTVFAETYTSADYTVPSAPYMDGYNFNGWKVNGTLYTTADDVQTAVETLVKAGTAVTISVDYEKKTEIENFVDRLYTSLLNQSVNENENEKASLVSSLSAQTTTAAEAVAKFALSDSIADISNAEFVSRMYSAVFNRNADAGKVNWENLLNNGMSRKIVIQKFTDSEEFANICASCGMTQGKYESDEIRDSNILVTSFVNNLYLTILWRTPDVAGINNFVGALLNGASTDGIVKEFILGAECKGKNYTNEEFIIACFGGILGRTGPNVEAIDGGKLFLDTLNAGILTKEEIVDSLLNSEEYINRLNVNGLTK